MYIFYIVNKIKEEIMGVCIDKVIQVIIEHASVCRAIRAVIELQCPKIFFHSLYYSYIKALKNTYAPKNI